MDDGNRNASEKPKSDEALLAVGKPIIFEGESETLEDKRSVNKVESVCLQVDGSFCFRPSEHHGALYIHRVMTSTRLLLRSNAGGKPPNEVRSA